MDDGLRTIVGVGDMVGRTVVLLEADDHAIIEINGSERKLTPIMLDHLATQLDNVAGRIRNRGHE